jgi:hypothetical protein
MNANRTFFVLVVSLCLLPVTAKGQVNGQVNSSQSGPDTLNQLWSRGRAVGKGPVKLEHFPLRVEDISHINPMGMMASGHTTPTDHLYLVAKQSQSKDKLYDVLAVADGHVVVIQWRPNPRGGQPDPTVFDRAVDLKVVLEHSANVWSYVDHLVKVEEFIRQQAGQRLQPGQPVQVRVPVKAGQVIGKVTGGFTFDFALIDTTVTRTGFVVPGQFLHRDPWKLHTVDPFDYVDEPLRSQLLAFNPRKAPPLGGKIDHDVDGRLVGNWYREGTGGYAGLSRRWDYWVGHLAFAYHHVNPSIIIISVGEWDGRAQQFAVRGNSPDPAAVGRAEGMVKYSLIAPQIDNRTGQPFAESPERYYGTMLVELLQDRKLRLEIFPGKPSNEVTGFSSAARLYER